MRDDIAREGGMVLRWIFEGPAGSRQIPFTITRSIPLKDMRFAGQFVQYEQRRIHSLHQAGCMGRQVDFWHMTKDGVERRLVGPYGEMIEQKWTWDQYDEWLAPDPATYQGENI